MRDINIKINIFTLNNVLWVYVRHYNVSKLLQDIVLGSLIFLRLLTQFCESSLPVSPFVFTLTWKKLDFVQHHCLIFFCFVLTHFFSKTFLSNPKGKQRNLYPMHSKTTWISLKYIFLQIETFIWSMKLAICRNSHFCYHTTFVKFNFNVKTRENCIFWQFESLSFVISRRQKVLPV